LIDIRVAKIMRRIDELGLRGELIGRIVFWPGTAITFRVEEIFEQTPGPNAGRRIEFARVDA
jgi:hypothetical protein